MGGGFFGDLVSCLVPFNTFVGGYTLELDGHAGVFLFDCADCVVKGIKDLMSW